MKSLLKITSIFLLLITILFVSFIQTTPVYADPPGNTTSLNLVLTDPLTSIIKGAVYLPWTSALTIIKDNVDTSDPTKIDFNKYLQKFSDFLHTNLKLTNNGEECDLNNITIPKIDNNELLFGTGFEIDYQFDCKQNIGSLIFYDNLFTDTPGQINSVNIYKNDTSNLIQAGLLTKEVNQMTIGEINGKTIASTNQSNNLITSLSSQLTSSSLIVILLIVFVLGFLHTLEAGHSKTVLGAALVDNKVDFKQATVYAGVFTLTHIADILIMGVILLVANSFIDIFSKLPYLQIFSLYTIFFIALYLLLKNSGELIKKKVEEYMHKEQHDKGVHHEHDHHTHDHNLRYNEPHHYHNHSHEDHEHGHSHDLPKGGFKHQLLMGFVAGIAPCIFGWSIFMVILSTKSILTIFPVILVFGLGIFSALILFAFIISKIKDKLLKEGSLLAELSPILSALILLIYSLMQIIH